MTMNTHWNAVSGTVENRAPPYWTMRTWIITIPAIIPKNAGFPRKNGGIMPLMPRQLIPFQACATTKPAKECSRLLVPGYP